ncbi:hypothetical protein K1567_08525 [Pseudomonas sp. S5F11]|uniref:hypothetical protein n=1 Tax=Pseudomonas sp. S5F11 TaxID=2866385 RepID=UPI001C7D2CAC|nr:hypothetical protein [Pseudomonas sp. S5F11]MBX4135963.1 hypothetical protein [Pseudomonas sp. S5F11]
MTIHETHQQKHGLKPPLTIGPEHRATVQQTSKHFSKSDAFSVMQRSISPEWELKGAGPSQIQNAATSHNAFINQLDPFINHRVKAATLNFIVVDHPPLNPQLYRHPIR